MQYRKPNALLEWCEAERYPQIFTSFDQWVQALDNGVVINPKGLNISNTDYDESLSSEELLRVYESLCEERRGRVNAMFKTEQIDLPIVMFHNGVYELIGGNTRLVKMGLGFEMQVLLISI